MPTNNFLPFTPTDTGTNLLTQGEYAAAADRSIGNQPGVASSKLNNKAMRQSSYLASQIAQYLADTTGADILDDATPAKLLAQLNAGLGRLPPIIRRYVASATYNSSFVFKIATGSATIGDTYTNNGVTYTVSATVAAAVQVIMTGNGNPAVSGTLTRASGTGDATLTFYAYRAPLFIEVPLLKGGGGGGSGSGSSAQGQGADGGASSIGGTLLVANGGGGSTGNTGVGGTTSSTAGATLLDAVTGGTGGGAVNNGAVAVGITGGMGGGCGGGPGGGGATAGGSPGKTAPQNSGGGGGGASCIPTINNVSGAGGAAGGFLRAIINSPARTYAVVVGSGGAGGIAGVSGAAGGDGADGAATLVECFQ